MKKPCLTPGCPELVEAGRCQEHTKDYNRDRYNDGRKTAAQRGYNWKWQNARGRYLRQHPICANCERQGRTTAGLIVDHIVPVIDGQQDPLFWNTTNWQTLCRDCDNAKKPLDTEIRRQYDDGLTLEQAKRYAINLMETK